MTNPIEPIGPYTVRPDPDPTQRTVELLNQSVDEIRRDIGVHSTIREREHATLQELIETQIGSIESLTDEKFKGITLQFAERDTRTTQAAETSQKALDAALLAAAALVNQQNDANATAATVQTLSFTKQIDQIIVLTERSQKAFDDRLAELKERIDRGDGSTSGSKSTQAQLIAFAGVLLILFQIAVVLYVSKK